MTKVKDNGWSVIVKTGDHKGSGTDANIYVAFTDKDGKRSDDIKLDVILRDDFERGKEDTFPCNLMSHQVKLGIPVFMELWRDDRGGNLIFNSSWFCERVTLKTPIEDLNFPVLRWVKPGIRYKIPVNDTSLPEDDPFPEQRMRELGVSRERYQIRVVGPNLPIQIAELPDEEQFSDDVIRDLADVKSSTNLGLLLNMLDFRKWTKYEHVNRAYIIEKSFKQTQKKDFWDSDEWFAAQRLVGVNPMRIKLCTEIPKNFSVTNELVEPYLDGLTLEEALETKRLFIVDYTEADGVLTVDDLHLCAPFAMFFVNNDKKLMPVAIQLFQNKTNPVFTPGLDAHKWIHVKLWFNVVDACFHQTGYHLGLTHLAMESISVCVHICLAKNHPMYRLLAPHFLYLMAINKRAVLKLMNPGGIVDQSMACGAQGGYQIVSRMWPDWSLDIQGTLPKELASRGVDDPSVLPEYPYRDDGLLVYNAIKEYVTDIVNIYYDTPEKIQNDPELQHLGKLLATPRQKEGAGIKGMPNGGEFKTTGDIIDVCTSIIFTCSGQHAAVNFGQYESYGHALSYSGKLRGQPPKNTDPITEEDVMKSLPERANVLASMAFAKLLSSKVTYSLGQWEVRYQYDPRAIEAEKRFQEDLKSVSAEIKSRNEVRSEMYKYSYLDPELVPNAISI